MMPMDSRTGSGMFFCHMGMNDEMSESECESQVSVPICCRTAFRFGWLLLYSRIVFGFEIVVLFGVLDFRYVRLSVSVLSFVVLILVCCAGEAIHLARFRFTFSRS